MIKVTPGKESQVIGQAREAVGGKALRFNDKPFIFKVTGPYDVIAFMKTDTIYEFRGALMKIRKIEGVMDTITSIVVK